MTENTTPEPQAEQELDDLRLSPDEWADLAIWELSTLAAEWHRTYSRERPDLDRHSNSTTGSCPAPCAASPASPACAPRMRDRGGPDPARAELSVWIRPAGSSRAVVNAASPARGDHERGRRGACRNQGHKPKGGLRPARGRGPLQHRGQAGEDLARSVLPVARIVCHEG